MEENKEKDLEDIFLDAKEYIDTRIEYTKLSAVEKGSKIFADLITSGAVIVSFILAFLFASFTLALFLSDVLGSYARGFGCVAGIYLLLSIIVYLTKDKYIEKLLVNMFIKRYFDKVADKDDDDEEKL
ncbi:MAG: phage holin family protein [Bacteroidota bacterium]|jgi:Putative Actinobacterial Holin-X, holin superfamily III|uniref:Phage holin family protein n=1 Tax=Pedobacter cryotolerans TaxID=2571270 RepID=A0A4U1C8Y9_9SPHI|nr:phage holin family protein [Pedobacter cryotolerans]TKC02108.1 phage holin family protein [Pedobacter cryotolerans]